ncbi:MAG: radical SAM protein, partial [Deltaproteobacteria bacterium]|nr:radical SAM protein [Deltaproteobacteria bacterium]
GEHSIVKLVDSLAAGKKPLDIPGVSFRQDSQVYFGPDPVPIEDLDSLAFPAWDLLDGFPAQYRPALFKYKQLPSTHAVSARGCPNKCIFCDTSVFGRRVRFHSPEYVLEMADYLVKDFGIKEIIFEDDQFLLKKERVEKICEGFLNAKWRMSWSCSGRVNSANDLGLLKLMKQSGCWQINYGIESGSQEILDSANKAITTRQVERAVYLTTNAGILSKGYFILGLPQETEETMKKTIRFAKSLSLNDVSVFMLTPFPGSRMYKIAEHYGVFDKDFHRMNILNAVYVPRGLSKEKLLYYQRRFMRQFYLRPRIISNYLERLMTNPLNVANMFKAACGFFRHVWY